MNITTKEQHLLDRVNTENGHDYQVLVNHLGLSMTPKSYVGTLNSLKKKGLVEVDGVGVKALVKRV